MKSRRPVNSTVGALTLLMKIISRILLVGVLGIFSACGCSWMKEFNEPERPTKVHGWEPFQVSTFTVQGDFVLNKGESVNDGNIGITVLDIQPGSCGAFHEPTYPAAKLRFFRVSDHSVLCEDNFLVGGARLDVMKGCESLKWLVVGVSGINSKDNWV